MFFQFFRDLLKKSPLESYVLFSFILSSAEKLVELGFVCPCMIRRNHLSCCTYALLPGCTVFAITFVILEQDNKCKQIGYSVISLFIWIALFLLDGRYVACAASNWEGIYTRDSMPWCKPVGNGSKTATERRLETQEFFFKSEVWGLVLMLIIIIVVTVLHCNRGQGPKEEEAQKKNLRKYQLKNVPLHELLEMRPNETNVNEQC